MKPLTRDEKQSTLDAFAVIDDVPKLPTYDRTTVERWGTCPWQAKACENGMGQIMPAIAESGEQIHQCFGRVTRWLVENANEMITKQGIVQELEDEILQSRPDVLPDAVRGMRASMWAWASFIREIAPANILHFDGGAEVGRCGQLAWEYPHLQATLTAEMDLLCAGPSPELLHLTDYKSGNDRWTAADVAESFQFQFYATLILRNYEYINGVEVVIWNTRFNQRTFRVVFHRKDLPTFEARIAGALKYRYLHGSDDCPPTWPEETKCAQCPVAMMCPAAEEPYAELATEEGEKRFVDQMVSLEARLKAMQGLAVKRADAIGRELRGSDGAMFGRQKPPVERKKPAALYSTKAAKE